MAERETPDTDGKTRRELDYEALPRSPSALIPAVPEALAAVALKALAPSPEDRFATPAEFKEALEPAVAGAPMAARIRPA